MASIIGDPSALERKNGTQRKENRVGRGGNFGLTHVIAYNESQSNAGNNSISFRVYVGLTHTQVGR